MASYLGAFPFPSLAPSILTVEALLKVVVIMTERYGQVLKRGEKDRKKLFFRSVAVFDRRLSTSLEKLPNDLLESSPEAQSESSGPDNRHEKAAPIDTGEHLLQPALARASPTQRKVASSGLYNHTLGFSIDQSANDDDEDEDEDELALAALDSLDAIEVFKHDQRPDSKIQHSHIPVDNFRRLVMFLLIIAPLGPQENLSLYAQRLSGDRLETLRRVANSILWAYAPEHNAGISYRPFIEISTASLPYMFDGLNPLFEHFLFSKNIDLSRRNHQHIDASIKPRERPEGASESASVTALLPEEGDILNIHVLSQLSFFIKGAEIFHRLRPLFFGEAAGFSLGSFEQKVFNWDAPTILLVSGKRLPQDPCGTRQRAFAESLPAKRFGNSSSGNSSSDRLVYGAYLHVPWKLTYREPVGDDDTLLFQLEPIHEVFRASKVVKDYAIFNKTGLGFGNPLPPVRNIPGNPSQQPLGSVSMFLDSSLEFGVFNHDTAGGGAFQSSQSRQLDWQDRFEIESLEVWGCGGDDEARRQLDAVRFEAREAEARKGVTLGKDREADRALLEMAGLIGNHNASGGSMG